LESKDDKESASEKERTFLFSAYLEGTYADNQADMTKEISKLNWTITADCPVRNVLDRFGDKWSILVLLILGINEKMRFTELNREIGDVSQKMLTVTLRTLEADGLVKRTVYPEIPPRVEYEITRLGESLLPHINSLAQWANSHYGEIEKSRSKFLKQQNIQHRISNRKN
jgi:DNA-binding HxlR family transcriptional regulator